MWVVPAAEVAARGETCARMYAHMKLVSRTFRTSMAITTDPADLPTSDAILDFWFGAPGEPEYGTVRALWFTKSEHTDATIRKLFEPAIEAALVGGFAEWTAQPRSRLALVLLLDQFTRNIFRDTPRAFAGDARALHLARSAVASGQDMALPPLERGFLYMPFEHSEVLADQRESVRLFTRSRARLATRGRSSGRRSTSTSSSASAASPTATRSSAGRRPSTNAVPRATGIALLAAAPLGRCGQFIAPASLVQR